MKENFDNYCWHDAKIINISLDWNVKNIGNVITIHLEWADDSESKILFKNVYSALLDPCFVGDNWIYSAQIDNCDPYFVMEIQNIMKMETNIKYNCYIFEIFTNIRNLKIIAKDFEEIIISKK